MAEAATVREQVQRQEGMALRRSRTKPFSRAVSLLLKPEDRNVLSPLTFLLQARCGMHHVMHCVRHCVVHHGMHRVMHFVTHGVVHYEMHYGMHCVMHWVNHYVLHHVTM